jgi:topoisomerase-4 subunit A
LNTDEKGQYLGSFEAEEKILVFYKDGTYEITDQELLQRFEADKIIRIEKFNPEKIVTAVYLDKEKLQYNIKRFKIETTTLHNKFLFIKEGDGNELREVTTDAEPILLVQSGRGSQVRSAKFKVVKMAEVMGWKAVGTKLVDYTKSIEMEWEKKKDSSQPELFE